MDSLKKVYKFTKSHIMYIFISVPIIIGILDLRNLHISFLGLPYREAQATIFAAILTIIGVILTVIIAVNNVKRQLEQSRRLETDWRKGIYKALTTPNLGIEQILQLRASLNYLSYERELELLDKCSSTRRKELKGFGLSDDIRIKGYMINFCDCLIAKYEKSKLIPFKLSSTEKELTRLYLRYLYETSWKRNNNHPEDVIEDIARVALREKCNIEKNKCINK